MSVCAPYAVLDICVVCRVWEGFTPLSVPTLFLLNIKHASAQS
jgi:hypothetical protein